MLFHLINRNPNKDITLHVSANNSAMVWLLSLSEIIKLLIAIRKATLQSVWLQSGRVHRRLLRRLPRPAVPVVKKCVPLTATPLKPRQRAPSLHRAGHLLRSSVRKACWGEYSMSERLAPAPPQSQTTTFHPPHLQKAKCGCDGVSLTPQSASEVYIPVRHPFRTRT
jgi:hypothetical protein